MELQDSMDYISQQQEICKDTGRRHWQGYVEMRERQQLSFMKLVDPTAHWEVRRGTQEEAIKYTKKSDTAVAGTWFEQGVKHRQDASKRLQVVCELIKQGMPLSTIAFDHPVEYVMFNKGLLALELQLRKRPPKFRHVGCWLLYGAPGSGKTSFVMNMYDESEVYIKDESEWWQDYASQPVLLFDDFYGNFRMSSMLRWCDGHPTRLGVKGLHAYACWTRVFVTSNEHRNLWYNSDKIPHAALVRDALQRRLPNHHCIRVGVQDEDSSFGDWPERYRAVMDECIRKYRGADARTRNSVADVAWKQLTPTIIREYIDVITIMDHVDAVEKYDKQQQNQMTVVDQAAADAIDKLTNELAAWRAPSRMPGDATPARDPSMAFSDLLRPSAPAPRQQQSAAPARVSPEPREPSTSRK